MNKRDNGFMEKASTYLLLFLMKTDGEQCPPKYLFPINEESLLTITVKNKAIPFLFHFLNCSSCKQKLSKNTLEKLSGYRKLTSFWPHFYQDEKSSLGKFCQKKKIKAVLMKELSNYKKMAFHQKYLMGVDLDILIKKNDLTEIESFLKKRGYKLKEHLELKNKRGKIYYQEKNFIHPKKRLSIDLHPQLAIPHKDEFHFLSLKIIEKAGKEILQNSVCQKESRLYVPEIEYLLLSLIIHYLGSDILKGARNLFDIIQLANLYDDIVDWKKFLILTRNYKIYNYTCFIILLGCRIFDLSIPKGFRKSFRIPLRVKYLVNYWPIERITIFPYVEKWQLKNKKIKAMFDENFFLKLLLVDDVPLQRLVRVRLFIFCLRLLVDYWFNRFVFHLYQRFSSLRSIWHRSLAIE